MWNKQMSELTVKETLLISAVIALVSFLPGAICITADKINEKLAERKED